MNERKHRLGDRRDGYWLRDIPAMNQIMPSLMPNRVDNEAFISLDIDLRPMDAYLERKNAGKTEDKYTYFHLISAAIGKAFVLRPRMNRFIANNRVYQRKGLPNAFVVKKKFEDKSEEGLAFLEFREDMTLDDYHADIMRQIHATRRADVKDASSGAMDLLVKMPHFLTHWIVRMIAALDRHGRAPKDMIATDPHHAAIFLSNLGSIGLECGYHHLVNFGTNSCFVVIGKKHWTKTYAADGSEDLH